MEVELWANATEVSRKAQVFGPIATRIPNAIARRVDERWIANDEYALLAPPPPLGSEIKPTILRQ